jgi:hypothetical protein
MIESKEEVLLRTLKRYYANDTSALQTLTEVLRGRTGLSLRTLDWLVTNYSKKNNITYQHGNKVVNVYMEYKGCLKAYSKRLFDPFQRRNRISIVDSDGTSLQSTIGQLNFFRFALSNGIIQYALQHLQVIEQDMMQSVKNRTSSGGVSTTKRKELSRAAIKSATSTDIKVTVRFS